MGPPVASAEIKLADCADVLDRSGKPYLASDTSHYGTPCMGRGESWIRGPAVSSGYYMQEKKTKEDKAQKARAKKEAEARAKKEAEEKERLDKAMQHQKAEKQRQEQKQTKAWARVGQARRMKRQRGTGPSPGTSAGAGASKEQERCLQTRERARAPASERERERDHYVALPDSVHEGSLPRRLVGRATHVCAEQLYKAQRVLGPRAVNTST